MTTPQDVLIRVSVAGASITRLDEETRALLVLIRESGVGSADLVINAVPSPGAKAASDIVTGLISLKAIGEVLPALGRILADWAGKREGREVSLERTTPSGTIKIKVTGPIASDDLRRLLRETDRAGR